MKRFNYILIIIGLSINLLSYGQEDISRYENLETAISKQFKKTVSELESSLKNTDPYGFFFSVSIVAKDYNEEENHPYQNETTFNDLHDQVIAFSTKENFVKFDFDREAKEIIRPGKFIYAAGIMVELVTDNPAEYLINANRYSYKHTVNEESKTYVIHISASALIKKPAGGSIVTDLYYTDEDGNSMLWDASWGSKTPEVSYIRVGPGNKTSNTRKNPDVKGKPDHNGQLVVQGDYSPGYYQPIVEFRGCKQDFTNFEKFQNLSAILQLEKTGFDWNQITYFDDGTCIPKSTLKTETMKAGDLKSHFSKGNIVSGTIFDNQTAEPLEKEIDVTIKPKFSPSKFETRSVKSKSDGTFEFTNIESGIYNVYPEGNIGDAQTVEVCNCPEKQESANYKYSVTLMYGETLYTVIAEYKNPKLLNTKVMWKNVTIGFPVDIHEEPPVINDAENANQIKPPFSVIAHPYGKFSFYSSIPEKDDKMIVINKKSNQPNMQTCIVDGGSFLIKKSKLESPHIFTSLSIDAELKNEEDDVFLLIPIIVGAAISDNSPFSFNWKQLDYSIIEKLKNGQAANKTLTNSQGATMNIHFKPQN